MACVGVIGQQAGYSSVQQRARVPCGDVAVERGSVLERVGQTCHLSDIPDAVCRCVGLLCVVTCCSERAVHSRHLGDIPEAVCKSVGGSDVLKCGVGGGLFDVE